MEQALLVTTDMEAGLPPHFLMKLKHIVADLFSMLARLSQLAMR